MAFNYLIGKGNRWALSVLHYFLFFNRGLNFRRLLIDTSDPEKLTSLRNSKMCSRRKIQQFQTLLQLTGIMIILEASRMARSAGWLMMTAKFGNSSFRWDGRLFRPQVCQVEGRSRVQDRWDDIEGHSHTWKHNGSRHTFWWAIQDALFRQLLLGEGNAVLKIITITWSLELILSLNYSVIYPDHGDVIDDPVEKIQYYINHRIKRERQILEATVASQKPLTTMEIVKIVHTTSFVSSSRSQRQPTLIKLKKEGKIVDVEDGKETKWKPVAGHINKL